MPIKHQFFRKFLETSRFSIENLKEKLVLSKQEQLLNELTSAYNNLIEQLIQIRDKHIQIVTLFVLLQASKNHMHPQEKQVELF